MFAVGWGSETLCPHISRQPTSVFTAGPGTVLSIRVLDLPFLGHYFAVKYLTDAGEVIEIRQRGTDTCVVQGMRGILTYTTHPEKIVSFRVVDAKL